MVPDAVCKTSVIVKLHPEGITEDGAPNEPIIIDTKCNFQNVARTVYNGPNKTATEIGGTLYFNGDIAPEMDNIARGEVTVYGTEREIISASKARNVDGSVNYTKLEVK